ncbi:hypothetical protein LH435_15300 [Laribacter hongkongensis]|uniref:hypothetical protein n=1 Tax=Laribacter hongkongensis TaxID=168471 RepID=UPI001EFE5F13|nr:hypothetical protein [Laribacter hongkongensis]MCG8996674.1 hypothetical protein [Laribacter hongkongensis]MCG9011953.1 hypothetical protein [Laribacter hongkongensis]MCG9048410.1 hypothetical protein [Laribacter hongkongensis]MCG9075338.1 hypothetical protein [Laribacter hongkongensis]
MGRLFDIEQWDTVTLADAMGELADMDAGMALFQLKGKNECPVAALVLIRGDDTRAYLDVLEAKEQELESAVIDSTEQVIDPNC